MKKRYWLACFVSIALVGLFLILNYQAGRGDVPDDLGEEIRFPASNLDDIRDNINNDEVLLNEEKVKKIAFLGDSLFAPPSMVTTLVGEGLGVDTINLSIGGSPIVNGVWADYNDDMVSRYETIPPDSDIIIIKGGLNDFFLNQVGGFSFENYCIGVQKLFTGIKNKYPSSDVFIITNPKTNSVNWEQFINNSHTLDEYMQVQRDLAAMLGFVLFDFYAQDVLDSTNVIIRNLYVPDGVHLNTEGDKILADQIIYSLQKYYGLPITAESNDTISLTSNLYGDSAKAVVAWEVLARELTEKLATEGNDFNFMVMAGYDIIVPADIIDIIRNTEVTLLFNTGTEVTLGISGVNIPPESEAALNLDLSLKKDLSSTATNIMVPFISRSDFGMPVRLHFNVGMENANKKTTLYFLDEENEEWEYLDSGQINETGRVVFVVSEGVNLMLKISTIAVD